MIGNDIIDLQTAAAESNWRKPGYLGKIFTPQEQDWILQSLHPDMTVWYLWSAKEAVYKIVNRATKQRTYAPLAYKCTVIDSLFYESLQTIPAFEAAYEAFSPISASPASYETVLPISASQSSKPISAFTGTLLHEATTYYFQSDITPHYIHTIAVTNPAHFTKLSITNDPSIPYHKDENGIPMMGNSPVSVSHHGRYYAMVKAHI